MSAVPETVDLLLTARWIIPVQPASQVLEDHALVVHQGRILQVLPRDEALQRFTPEQHLDLPEHVLIPGLINTHGHAAMSLLRGFGDDLPLMTWLNDYVWPAESRFVDERFIADGTQLAMAEMLRTGTTFFSDMYYFPEVVAEVAQHQGMRAQVCFPVLDFPTNWGSGPDEYLRKGLALRDQLRHSELIQVAFGPHAPYTISDGPLSQIATLAEQTGAAVQIHLHETAHEVTEAVQNTGLRPIRRLSELGLLTPTTQCVHMTQLDDNDIALLKESGAHVLHCPESNMKLASGQCPVHKLLEAGINVALGTDGAASNNDLDMFGEMRTAALLAKSVSGNAAAVSAHQALAMATINGAKALGREQDLGSLEAGKLADIVAVDLGDPLVQPVYDPASHLVYSTNSRQVSHSWIGGQAQLVDGKLKRIDLQELHGRIAQWQQQIQQAKNSG
ncbi:MAG: TRZ/ATZ family hydrolase [Halomonadaceae bacterium]|nr:MAG: TRZ/ATZ family hydrolase [Halomonadaceae bacterium]